MQIHLKLTRMEYGALMTVARSVLSGAQEPKEFRDFQEIHALQGLVLKMAARSIDLKAKVNMTLTEMEAYTIYQNVDVAAMPEYEGAVMAQVMREIDSQWMEKYALMRGNMMAQQLLS